MKHCNLRLFSAALGLAPAVIGAAAIVSTGGVHAKP